MLATNIHFKVLNESELLTPQSQQRIIDFLFTALEEYTDPKSDIEACLHYILDEKKGGQVFVAYDDLKQLAGCCLLAKTNMGAFVPEYLLVYIAVDGQLRGKGVGKAFLQFIKEETKAPIALHVEHLNPAKKLYEKVGFTNKYTEMRWYP